MIDLFKIYDEYKNYIFNNDKIVLSILLDLGFTYITKDSFTGKPICVIGKTSFTALGNNDIINIIIFDIKTGYIRINQSEYCNISKKCNTITDIKKFINYIKWIFDYSDKQLKLK